MNGGAVQGESGGGKAGGGMRVDYTLVPFSMILIKSTNANIW